MQSNYKRLGDYIRQVDVRNRDLAVTNLLGLSVNKTFIKSIANTIGTDMSPYKVVRKGQFVYIPDTSRRGDKIAIALLDETEAIVSAIYTVFEVTDIDKLLPDYLMMWFRRPEFDRYARFKSHGSAREVFDWDEMCDVMLPVPPIEEQRKIVAEYQAIEQRIANNRRLISSLEATSQSIYRNLFVDNIDPENLPEGWQLGTLEELTEFIKAGTIPIYVEESDYIVLGQKCNYNHTVDLSKCLKHTPKASAIPCKKGDVLINSTGTGTLGRVCVIKFEPNKLTFDSNMTMARPKNYMVAEYLFFSLMNLEQTFENISQGSTNQTRLYCSMIRPYKCIIPNDELLSKFHDLVSPLMNFQADLEAENIVLENTKPLQLAKLSK